MRKIPLFKLRQNILRLVSLLLVLLFGVISLGGCRLIKARRYSRDLWGYFDTQITILGYCRDQAEFDRYFDLAEQELSLYHRLCDRYNPYPDVANIFTINENAGQQAVTVSARLIDLLTVALDWQKEAPPGVNIALGSVLDIWHEYRTAALQDVEQAGLPPQDFLENAALHTDINQVIIDHSKNTVFLGDPKLSLDLGAVAKGYATEHTARTLKAAGWAAFAINNGGNVRTVGQPPERNRDHWLVGVENPRQTSDSDDPLLVTVMLKEDSLVTSGDYQRYYMVDGRRYHHIIDHKTLYPADLYRLVTVLTSDSGRADFLSTLLFILPLEQGQAYVASLNDVEVLWVLADGTMVATDGMKHQLADP